MTVSSNSHSLVASKKRDKAPWKFRTRIRRPDRLLLRGHEKPQSGFVYEHTVMWTLARVLNFTKVKIKAFERWFAGWYEFNSGAIDKFPHKRRSIFVTISITPPDSSRQQKNVSTSFGVTSTKATLLTGGKCTCIPLSFVSHSCHLYLESSLTYFQNNSTQLVVDSGLFSTARAGSQSTVFSTSNVHAVPNTWHQAHSLRALASSRMSAHVHVDQTLSLVTKEPSNVHKHSLWMIPRTNTHPTKSLPRLKTSVTPSPLILTAVIASKIISAASLGLSAMLALTLISYVLTA